MQIKHSKADCLNWPILFLCFSGMRSHWQNSRSKTFMTACPELGKKDSCENFAKVTRNQVLGYFRDLKIITIRKHWRTFGRPVPDHDPSAYCLRLGPAHPWLDSRGSWYTVGCLLKANWLRIKVDTLTHNSRDTTVSAGHVSPHWWWFSDGCAFFGIPVWFIHLDSENNSKIFIVYNERTYP
jgi:hypothetical protein